MFRGVHSPLAGVTAINAICFGVQGNVARRLTYDSQIKTETVAGMVSGFAQVLKC